MEVEANTLAKPKQRQFNLFKKNIKNKKESPSKSKTAIHCTIPRTISQSSNESFETLTPSVSATSVESAEDCIKMFTRHREGDVRVAPLESTSGEVGESDDDSNSIFRNDGGVAAEAAPFIPSNVSILSNESHDESFYSLHYDWFGGPGEDESSDDDSSNSFGPSNNNMIGLGSQDLGRIREASEEESGHSSLEDVGSDDSSVDAVYGGSIVPNETEAALPVDSHIGLRQRLQRMSINSSENKQAQEIPPPPPADTISHSGSAQRLLTPLTPIPKYIYNKSKQAHISLKFKKELAAAKYQAYKARRKEVKERRKQERMEQKSRIIVIPSNHKLKIMWDMATIALTFVSAYVGHIYIRDRSTYEYDWFVIFTNLWFFVDLLLNFFTEHRTSDGKVMKTGREVWGRYLTTWFAIDALSLFPWERMFLRPVIQKIKRRNIAVKWFFRSRAVVKVTVSASDAWFNQVSMILLYYISQLIFSLANSERTSLQTLWKSSESHKDIWI